MPSTPISRLGSLSRRALLGGLAGGVVLGPSIAAASDPDAPFPNPTGPPASTRALPVPLVSGAVAVNYGIADFRPIDTTGGPQVNVAGSPSRTRLVPPGPLFCSVPIPIGAALARVDMFGFASVAEAQQWAVLLIDMNTGVDTILASPTITGTGPTTTEFVPAVPAPLTAGQWHVVFAETNANKSVRGAVVQYLLPAPPATPIVHPVVPRRVFDSRLLGAKLAANEERTISVAVALDGSGEVVPAGATAVAITVTVTETDGAGGFVSVFPAATPWPGTSTVNWFGPGQNLATAAILALGGDRQLILRGGNAAAHVVVDVTAYVG